MNFGTIELKEYDLFGNLEDEQDALDELKEHTGYICDAINEVADSYIPIYTNDVWSNVSKIQEHIEEAISNGLAPTDAGVDLIKIFQAGYYQYYNQSLYNNFDAIKFNYVAEKVNEVLEVMDEKKVEEINFENLVEEIESETSAIDNNDDMSMLDDIAKEHIEAITGRTFEEDED